MFERYNDRLVRMLVRVTTNNGYRCLSKIQLVHIHVRDTVKVGMCMKNTKGGYVYEG